MAIQNNKDGTYTASWVPSTAGSYSIHICIEGSSPGTADAECVVLYIHCFFTQRAKGKR